jgi:hypothetical protein
MLYAGAVEISVHFFGVPVMKASVFSQAKPFLP